MEIEIVSPIPLTARISVTPPAHPCASIFISVFASIFFYFSTFQWLYAVMYMILNICANYFSSIHCELVRYLTVIIVRLNFPLIDHFLIIFASIWVFTSEEINPALIGTQSFQPCHVSGVITKLYSRKSFLYFNVSIPLLTSINCYSFRIGFFEEANYNY